MSKLIKQIENVISKVVMNNIVHVSEICTFTYILSHNYPPITTTFFKLKHPFKYYEFIFNTFRINIQQKSP